ncbi:membrane-spanning 4-domains subfamily A member 4D-like isoform X1 [Tachysurus fulvidraco]|uniref:membrane-spanning 4-domains subfamily A member 4D-like isoform X1 n=1 Tax=Tachysurus fulvidraco TaxID=1234273 RepID=UPI001FED6E45|nr:membrane-spanning 4-domains subfamily A member 4D-like isoform X1 [Tachysurus fulvidraco]
MACAPIHCNNVGRRYTIITTQVLPSSTAEHNSTQTLSPLSKFLKGEPKALGTVQIMIGLLTFLFGIVLATYTPIISIYSGVIFWGPVFHIISGSLAVSASNKLNSCVFFSHAKAILILNIISTTFAGIIIHILFLDLIFGIFGYVYPAQANAQRITGVLLGFALLQLSISVTLLVFTCKAICTSKPTLNTISVVPNPESVAPSAPVNNPFPAQEVNTKNDIAMATAPGENPPAYSEKCNQTTENG